MRRRRLLVGLAVVATVGIVGMVRAADDDPCRSTDGPQFRCWLLAETR